MTKEYDELVERVAKVLQKANAIESKPCLPWQSYIPDAKLAIRAIQDWMPDCGATKSLVERMSVEALSYQHFKTLGRNDENN